MRVQDIFRVLKENRTKVKIMNKGIKSIFLSFLFLLCCVDEEISSPTVETVGVETFTTNTATLKGSFIEVGNFFRLRGLASGILMIH